VDDRKLRGCCAPRKNAQARPARRSAIAAPTNIHPPSVPTKCATLVAGRLCARTYTGQNSANVIEDLSPCNVAQEPIINLSKSSKTFACLETKKGRLFETPSLLLV